VAELCAVFGVSPSWVYKRTKKGAEILCPYIAWVGGRFVSIRTKFRLIFRFAKGIAPMLR
jgi:hypothetical protein